LSLTIRRGKDLIDPAKFRMKILLFGLSGLGKTTFVGTADNPPGSLGVAACETGQGNGILTIAHKDVEFCTPTTLAELESLANGAVFKDKATIALDSLSYMNKSFVREAALAMPRKGLDSPKRAQGIPELDDFGSMAEMTRRILAKLLAMDKHIICTATEKQLSPNENNNVTETLYLPDLPGALALTCTAMFDFVLRLRVRQRLADPKDAKSRFVERYWVTQPDGFGSVVKCRSNKNEVPFLDKEEVFNPAEGKGTFPYFLQKILANYEKG
jgi:hypothetical protein